MGFVSLRFAALGLLAQQPGSGYDLLKRFEYSMANVWPATQSQLYGELNKLATAGLIEVTDIGARGRKEYSITPAGREELFRWMADTANDPPYRSTQLLRVFLLGETAVGHARLYMKGIAEQADSELRRLSELRDSLEWNNSDADFYGRVALEYGLRAEAMEAGWARWVTEEIDKRSRY